MIPSPPIIKHKHPCQGCARRMKQWLNGLIQRKGGAAGVRAAFHFFESHCCCPQRPPRANAASPTAPAAAVGPAHVGAPRVLTRRQGPLAEKKRLIDDFCSLEWTADSVLKLV